MRKFWRSLPKGGYLAMGFFLFSAMTSGCGGAGGQPASEEEAKKLEAEAEREEEARFETLRHLMVEEQIEGRGVRDEAVREAMRKVPRHKFLPPSQLDWAYEDTPLPIGHNQTISQPYIVGAMTELLDLKPDARVLEVGTGSGYQAAILAEIVAEVYTIEILEPLADRAEQTLQDLGYENVHVRAGDGYLGWPEHAPFDGIIVTCAPDHVPDPLVEQLKVGGKMCIRKSVV